MQGRSPNRYKRGEREREREKRQERAWSSVGFPIVLQGGVPGDVTQCRGGHPADTSEERRPLGVHSNQSQGSATINFMPVRVQCDIDPRSRGVFKERSLSSKCEELSTTFQI